MPLHDLYYIYIFIYLVVFIHKEHFKSHHSSWSGVTPSVVVLMRIFPALHFSVEHTFASLKDMFEQSVGSSEVNFHAQVISFS